MEPAGTKDPIDQWVTVFGFHPDEAAVVLEAFQRCGDIVEFGTYGEHHVNWVHIKYQVPPA
jgi:nuclear pore complex protein Nup53